MKNVKGMTMTILNGLSIGIIVALVPGAILNSVVKLVAPSWPAISGLLVMTTAAQSLLPALSAVCVGMMAKFTPIQTSSLALAGIMGAGNYHLTAQGLEVVGSGDVINLALTVAIGCLIINLLKTALKAYTILLLPSIVLVIAGGIGRLTLGPVGAITKALGVVVHDVTTLQPILMGILMGMIFALIIVSPISSVGIATAINLSGIGSGAANLGIVGASFALAVYGWQANSFGTSIAHFLGSPKIQMANLLAHPHLLVPMTINAGIMGGLGALFNIQGTAASAGFGFSGLVGPLAAIDALDAITVPNLVLIALLFVVLPLILGYVSALIFTHMLHYQAPVDYALSYD